jgi:hypothetical protein
MSCGYFAVGDFRENEIEHQRATGRPDPARSMAAAFLSWTAADPANAAQGGIVMDVENTDLERRVLAHEQILQALIAHMAETEPKFLDRLNIHETPHIGRWRAGLHRYGRIRRAVIQQVARVRDKGRHI